MNKLRFFSFFSVLALALLVLPALGHAAPQPWEIDFQPAASPVAVRMFHFHAVLFYVTTGIVAFVLATMLFIILRFNAKANPVPSTRSHNTPLEIIWTVIPVIILVSIAIPSFKLLFYADRTEHPDMTLKVTGNQWYWSYEYPDNGDISFDARLIPDADIDPSKGQIRLLSTDNPVVLPINTNIQLLTTASDVIHSFSVPSFGVKLDAVPGRVNETWVRITKPGYYYGQCDQLCGRNHGYMPIEVLAMSKDDFKKWVARHESPEKAAAAAAVSEKPATETKTEAKTTQH